MTVEWHAHLPKSGTYEILVYIPTIFEENSIHWYTIIQGDKIEEIKLDNLISTKWLSLGKFYCQEGECVVSLSDKGNDTQIIYADAVKWILTEE